MSPPPSDESWSTVAYRLDAMDKRLERMEGNVERLAFVNKEVYAADMKATDSYAQETRRIAEGARTVAWATAVLLIGSITAILAVIKAVAG